MNQSRWFAKRSVLFNFEGALKHGGLAQLGEHLLCKQGVKGSIPLISTNREGANSVNMGA